MPMGVPISRASKTALELIVVAGHTKGLFLGPDGQPKRPETDTLGQPAIAGIEVKMVMPLLRLFVEERPAVDLI